MFGASAIVRVALFNRKHLVVMIIAVVIAHKSHAYTVYYTTIEITVKEYSRD